MAGYARGVDTLKVGSLTVVAAVGFSILFMQMTNRGLSVNQWDVHVRIPTAEGLRKRDPVFFRGVDIGEVKSLAFTESGDVLVRARLKQRVALTRTAWGELSALDMFGRQSLVIHEGNAPAQPLLDEDTIAAAAPVPLTGWVADVGDRAMQVLTDENLAAFRAALSGAGVAGDHVAALSARVDTLILAQRASIDALLEQTTLLTANLAAATDPARLEETRAELGRLLGAMTRLAGALDTTVAEAGSVLRTVRAGEGSAGLLLHDPELYLRTTELLASADALLQDLRSNPKKYFSVSVF